MGGGHIRWPRCCDEARSIYSRGGFNFNTAAPGWTPVGKDNPPPPDPSLYLQPHPHRHCALRGKSFSGSSQ